ncbi:hypothetical protein WICPIJ_009379 [Wickerhamomyces pijperi]|uniref:Phospholipid-transporting ATPase n=1 Tax=Wickerhamomyces pijperi TaxID=599730 RepID=A0A9P8PMR4_WICPI|nr:hypothetical protein WICPIJ_009379 [Wickerhamomyces pijperi]
MSNLPPVDSSQQRRKRGYSLRSQLFFKNANSFKPELDSTNTESEGASGEPIELQNVEPPQPKTSTSLTFSEIQQQLENEPPEEKSKTRLPVLKTYSGSIGKVHENFVTIKNFLLNIRPYKKSKDGRKIPISVLGDFDQSLFPVNESHVLIDERYHQPFLGNTISSSRYSLYSFLPKQLYAQFSKIANIYFMTVSILQMIPSWSTTGTYTTIIPLLVFISISMLREAYDDWRRHLQDKKENNNYTRVVTTRDTHVADDEKRTKKLELRKSISHGSTIELNPGQFRDSEEEEEIIEQMLHQPNTFTREPFLKHLDLKTAAVKWKNIKIGDIVRLQQDEPVPADIIILTSDGQNENEVYVETMDLDGETNLKAKNPISTVSKMVNSAAGLKNFSGSVTVEDPNLDLYNFEGNLKFDGETYPLGPDNIIYRGSIIRNTPNVLGLVIFTGEETKIRMNAIKNPRTKAPKLQKAINLIVAFMVFVVIMLSFLSFMAQRINLHHNWDKAWYLYNQEAGVIPTIMSFIIMYNTLIPLSLYVTTEIIKLVQMMFLHWDIDMYHKQSDTPCEANTATILEELGQVSYIFSDKTGTLTDNMMVFKKFSVGGTAWYHETDPAALNYIEDDDDCSQDLHTSKGLASSGSESARNSVDIRSSHTRYAGKPGLASALTVRNSLSSKEGSGKGSPIEALPSNDDNDVESTQNLKTSLDLLEYIQHNPNTIFSKKAKFFILSLALCHTCLPKTIEEETDEIEYQSSSPDELALVLAARDMGYVVFGKNHRELTIRLYPNGFEEDPVDEVYEILNVVEFSSARKRMSMFVKFPDGRICMICKGADNVILERMKSKDLISSIQKNLNDQTRSRKAQEAELVLKQKKSMEINQQRMSFQIAGIPRPSISGSVASIDEFVYNARRDEMEIDGVLAESRKSLHLQQKKKYNIKSTSDYIGNVLNEKYVLERTLQHIEEFSSDGLRTLLYGFKWLTAEEYSRWALDYASAKTSLVNRAKLIEQVGCILEDDFELIGATAIEDKLQEGVSDSIEKLRRAGIKLWMLTGDKRETAINIGYSCKLIKDYSTVVVLDSKDEDVVSKMSAAELELNGSNVAHCVVVIDGATLADFEQDDTLLSMLISLCTKTDSVICCRASPSQKALMVTSIRNLNKKLVTLAIGDGANDIAMIQSADIGIGITGKEGLQAARSSDYSIAQFRFLQKLLLVHGRYNYIRTCKFVLATFYKELMFYLSQAIFQRNTLWTGTSLYEPWSLSMFNTLFTSLTVLCIGMFEKDLKPATLLAVPELYCKGRLSQAFNLPIFIGWMIIATLTSLLVCFASWYIWGVSATFDNNIYPMGVLTFTTIVFTVNIKFQFLEQRNITYLNFLAVGISCFGLLGWTCFLPGIYKETTSKIYDVYKGLYWKFGQDVTFWATLLILITMALTFDTIIQVLRNWFFFTDVDEFQILEKRIDVRRDLENMAYEQMKQSWTWDRDPSSFRKINPVDLVNKSPRKRKNTVTSSTELPPGAPSKVEKNTATTNTVKFDENYITEVLPSGKVIKRKINDEGSSSRLNFLKINKKIQRKESSEELDLEVEEILRERIKDMDY